MNTLDNLIPKKPVGGDYPDQPRPEEAEPMASLTAALRQLEAGESLRAAGLLQGLLRGNCLARGYPGRHLVSASHGLLVGLPEPRMELAQACLERAIALFTQETPGQAKLW